MSNQPHRLATNPNSRSKAASSTYLETTASVGQPRDASRHRGRATPDTPVTGDSLQSIELLIRRVLCPLSHAGAIESRPLDELLPPLSSSNAVDVQLYAIIAIVIRDFVYSWYGKITSDRTFVEEVMRIVAHCTRDLEQRLRRVDLTSLLFDEIPNLVDFHISTFKTAHSAQPVPNASDPEIVYHTLFPHPALSPAPVHGLSTVEQVKNEAVYRQLLVQGILAVLLPTEDLRNPCLRTLVSDVIGDIILGNGIGGKASAGWLIWDGIAKILEQGKSRLEDEVRGAKIEVDTRSRLEQFGLLSSREQHKDVKRIKTQRSSTISDAIWRILQFCYMVLVSIRFVVVELFAAASSAPSLERSSSKSTVNVDETKSPIAWSEEAPSAAAAAGKRPMLTYTVFGLVSQLLEVQSRMPWVYGIVSLMRHHLVSGLVAVGRTDGLIDKLLRRIASTQLLRPDAIPSLLQILRTSLFPNNALGPARPTPSPHEQRLIKRRAACAILELVNPSVAGVFFATGKVPSSNAPRPTHTSQRGSESRLTPARSKSGDRGQSPSRRRNTTGAKEPASPNSMLPPPIQIPDSDAIREMQLEDIECTLDLFGNQYMNKHLLYSLVELIVVRLIPETHDKSVQELLEERIGSGVP